jgi:hypothetical protein
MRLISRPRVLVGVLLLLLWLYADFEGTGPDLSLR